MKKSARRARCGLGTKPAARRAWLLTAVGAGSAATPRDGPAGSRHAGDAGTPSCDAGRAPAAEELIERRAHGAQRRSTAATRGSGLSARWILALMQPGLVADQARRFGSLVDRARG
jgi:hypothetical protein